MDPFWTVHSRRSKQFPATVQIIQDMLNDLAHEDKVALTGGLHRAARLTLKRLFTALCQDDVLDYMREFFAAHPPECEKKLRDYQEKQ
jgi:hypothetical protein